MQPRQIVYLHKRQRKDLLLPAIRFPKLRQILFLLPAQELARQKMPAFPHRGPSTIRPFSRRSRLRKNASNRLSVRIGLHMRRRRLTLQNQSS